MCIRQGTVMCMRTKEKTKIKARRIIIIVVSVHIAIWLFIGAIIGVAGLAYPKGYGFLVTKNIVENNIKYETNPVLKIARVSGIILTKGKTTYEIVVPEYLEDGTCVEGIGYVTKSIDLFGFSFENHRLSHELISEEEIEQVTVVDYYITFKIGKNIKTADPLLYCDCVLKRFLDTDEYIRVNFEYEVSLDNEYLYSQDGILYKK